MAKQGAVFWNASDGGAALRSMTAQSTSQLADYWSGYSPTHITRSYGVESAQQVSFAASISVQTKVFANFYRSKVGNSWQETGLLGRFLINAPTPGLHIHKNRDQLPRPKLADWCDRIRKLLKEYLENPNAEIKNIRLSEESKKKLQEFRVACETSSRPGYSLSDIRNAAGKAPENAARIAVNYHVLEGRSGMEIEVDIMEKAINTAAFFLDEQYKLFSEDLVSHRVHFAVDSMLRYMRRLEIAGVVAVPVSSLSKHGCKDLRDPHLRLAAINQALYMHYVSVAHPNMMSKNNIMLTDAGRLRAESTKFINQPIMV
jgi:hypothetical protein